LSSREARAMNSLRSRLILGSSLVALIPLALAMYLLSRQIESTVRTQAAERLSAALGAVQSQLAGDGRRISERLQIVARDPLLKRLYLLRPAGSRDLSEYLRERRVLLGLDFLDLADTNRAVIADGTGASVAADTGRVVWRVDSVPGNSHYGLQIESLEGVPALALAEIEAIRYESDIVGLLHGGLVFDPGFLARLARTSGMELELRDPQGRVVAATVSAAGGAVPAPGSVVERIERAGHSYLGRSVPLEVGPPPQASLVGLISTAAADRTIFSLQLTSALLGLLGLAIAILLGTLWSSQISRPVERLAAFSRRLAHGDWDEPLVIQGVREFRTLVAALERMRTDLRGYRDRLVISERQAAWSQMALKVAHEIKNPLTPIAISVADLKRSFDLKRADFPKILDQAVRTISEEVETLKHILEEFSEFGRFPPPKIEPARLAELLTDLETLYAREVTEGRLVFSCAERDLEFPADRAQLRQAMVNLIKNGLEAAGDNGRVMVSASVQGGALEIVTSDTGPGLTAEQKAHLFAPGFTTKAHGSGLGLTIVERIVSDHHGTIAADPGPESGTTFRIRLPLESRT
jgi:signal transduction histidine kinase